jgi:DNA replication protein DnaC
MRDKGMTVGLADIQCPVHGRVTVVACLDLEGKVYHGKCPRCETERLLQEKAEVEIRRMDPEMLLRSRMEAAGVPPLYMDQSFDTFREDGYSDPRRETRMEFQRFVGSQSLNLVLLGTPGVGKTHLGIALIREMLKTGRSARYVKEGVLLREIKATFGRKGETEQDVIDRYASYDLLVIDEVGLSPWTEYNSQAISDMLDDRGSAMFKTVFLGNLTAKEFKQHFNDQCISRIGYKSVNLELNTRDYRRVACQ